ncbi:MAG: glutamate-1-semialdehyde 2,1-aminomutase [Chitinispirillales bacterium]|jgi:glutamate-1-semialdehyde 2,1-aminomutase|nr:glutamate-1-semialdehyde 2,1-aminomutase [Chitinispirillales bacterium]
MSKFSTQYSFSGSIERFAKAASMIPGGVNSPVRAFKSVGGTPVFLSKAKGSRFWDVDGNEFVDFCQSWGPLILGHADERVVEAVQTAARSGLSFGACHEGEIRMAELILSAMNDFDRVRLMSSGTEAVMTALRLARGATGRDLIVKFQGGYHGHSDSMLVKAGSGLVTGGEADSRGVPSEVAAQTIVTSFDDEEGVDAVFSRYGDRIAAVIIEPLPANNGLLVQRQEFLQFLRDITLKFGALLIFDEVISGFRLRFGGYYQIAGVIPDLVTLGKIIGGGMPVGALVGRRDLMENLAPQGGVYQAGTLSGNPVSLAAGIETLRILSEETVYTRLEMNGQKFASLLKGANIPALRLQRAGSILWLYLDDCDLPRRTDMISGLAMQRYKEIFRPVLERGFYLPPSPYEVMFLSASHSELELTEFADVIIGQLQKTSISQVQ